MVALTIRKNHLSKAMKQETVTPFLASGAFHLLIIVLTTMGLPMVAQDPMIIAKPITVEIVEIDKITQTNKKPAPPKPEQSTSKPELSPKVDTPVPPDLTKSATEDVPVPSDIAPPEPPKDIAKPKQPPKRKPAPPAPEKQNTFESLLKNLAPDAEEIRPIESTVEEALESEKPNTIDRFSDRLSISEEDALRRQLGQCWNVMSGAKYAEDLVVKIQVVMNPDRTVQRATIIHSGQYNRDSHYRAAADAALRALRNPRCSPLALPPEKYEQWKTMTIRFDPREML